MLDVQSASKGMLIPRMTTAQRDAIPGPAKGLMVFCTDKNQLYVNKGTPVIPFWSATLSIPISDTFNYESALLDLTNIGNGGGAKFSINNPNSYWPAVYAETYGPGWTIQSYNHGAADGFAGYFRNTSPTNNWPAIQGKTAGTGSVFRAYQDLGPGPGMDVFMLYPTSTSPGIRVDQQGLGNAAEFIVNNAATTNHALYAESNAGTTIFANKTGGTENEAILGLNSASGGFAVQSLITNPANGWPSFTSGTSGTGNAGEFSINNAASWADTIWTHSDGTGHALRAVNTGIGGGIWAEAGSGEALHLKNSSSLASTLVIDNQGSSAAIWSTAGEGNALVAINQSSTGEAIWAQNNGSSSAIGAMGTTGSALYAFNASAASATIWAENHGSSTAIGASAGVGRAIHAINASPENAAIWAQNDSTGKALEAMSAKGTTILAHKIGGADQEAILAINDAPGGYGIQSLIYNTSNSYPAISATTSGTGNAGQFIISNSGNSSPAISAGTNGSGTALLANHTGGTGNIAVFQSSYANKARIDKNGKGFFNGGTQNSGADLAELFDVEGETNNYEPGDVMVISELSDRTMEKSSTAVSTRVAGVYATKPGVVLTEMGVDDNLDALVPVGVIGVIPTKVCDQNGPIKRGDLLVTSSIPGHAMKAIPVDIKGVLIYPTGAILGKALENFENGKAGLIKVLVNVK
jgi:hypothetical protein